VERIGEKLRKRREELGFTIDDIARSTNFRPELIRAVEGGRTTAFSADAYLNAFLRAYATKLDLDPREIILEQKSEEERIHDALSGMKLGSRKPVSIPRWLLLALILAAVAVGLFIVYDRVFKDYVVSGPGDAGAFGGGTAHRSDTESVPADAAGSGESTAGPGESTMDGQGEAGSANDSDPVLEQDPGAAAGEDTEAARDEAEPGNDAPEKDVTPAGGQWQPAPEDEEPAAVPLKQQPDSLSLSVSGWSTHVKLSSGDALLLDEMLNPGYSKTFYSREPFVFDHITNKDAVSLLFNGRPVRIPNSSGSKLVSDLRLPREGR
jgi:cytoskeleton protein RodZ